MTDRRRGKRVILGLLAVALVALLAAVGLRSERSPGGGPLAPALPQQTLIGGPVSVAGLISSAHGRPSLVLFWASWCGPCKNEAPEIERFAQSSQGSGRIVGVNWSDGLAGAKGFLAKYHWSFPNLRDGDGTVGNAYRLTGLPTTFVLNDKGRIINTLRGPQTKGALHSAMSAAESG